MSQTVSEPVLQTPPRESAPPQRRSWTRWPRWIVLFLVFLWLADLGVSLLIRHTRLQRRLTARLESVFGRSVEVGRYNFSLRVRLRWQSFFRGHMEWGAISLESPRLNLVRNAEGDWNVAEWLPKSAASAPPSSTAPAVRFGRIDVTSGRINFKRDD